VFQSGRTYRNKLRGRGDVTNIHHYTNSVIHVNSIVEQDADFISKTIVKRQLFNPVYFMILSSYVWKISMHRFSVTWLNIFYLEFS